MQPTFERGDPKRPRGHALVYFQASDEPDVVMACYIVVPPISMDFAKYVPPMFAAQLGSMIPSGPSVFPLPPIPERVPSLEHVRQLAAKRDDDLLDGGKVIASDFQRLLMSVTEIAGEYGHLYAAYAESAAVEEPEREPEALPGVDVDDLLFSVMSDAEKIGRLAKLTGSARYALEGGDRALLAETVKDMERVGRHLPDGYRVTELIQSAQDPTDRGGRLAQLHLERCYKLSAGEYSALDALDAEIASLASTES